jgi:hypothetical protein
LWLQPIDRRTKRAYGNARTVCLNESLLKEELLESYKYNENGASGLPPEAPIFFTNLSCRYHQIDRT